MADSASMADSADDGASMADSADNGLNSSAISKTAKRQRSGLLFRAWSFQMTVKANLLHGTTTPEKIKLLTDQLSICTALTKPLSVTSLSTFCDDSLLSGQPDSNGLVSIEVHGYVQTKQGTSVSTMLKFIDSASWKPLQGGLTSDRDFKEISQRFARLYVFGTIGLNNSSRAEERSVKQVPDSRLLS